MLLYKHVTPDKAEQLKKTPRTEKLSARRLIVKRKPPLQAGVQESL